VDRPLECNACVLQRTSISRCTLSPSTRTTGIVNIYTPRRDDRRTRRETHSVSGREDNFSEIAGRIGRHSVWRIMTSFSSCLLVSSLLIHYDAASSGFPLNLTGYPCPCDLTQRRTRTESTNSWTARGSWGAFHVDVPSANSRRPASCTQLALAYSLPSGRTNMEVDRTEEGGKDGEISLVLSNMYHCPQSRTTTVMKYANVMLCYFESLLC